MASAGILRDKQKPHWRMSISVSSAARPDKTASARERFFSDMISVLVIEKHPLCNKSSLIYKAILGMKTI